LNETNKINKRKRARFRCSIINSNPISQFDLEKYLDQRYKVRKTVIERDKLDEISIDKKSRKSIMNDIGIYI
jgi:hypothetical protein